MLTCPPSRTPRRPSDQDPAPTRRAVGKKTQNRQPNAARIGLRLLAVALAVVMVVPTIGVAAQSSDEEPTGPGPHPQCEEVPPGEAADACDYLVEMQQALNLGYIDPCIEYMARTGMVDSPDCAPLHPIVVRILSSMLHPLWYMPAEIQDCEPDDFMNGGESNDTQAVDCQDMFDMIVAQSTAVLHDIVDSSPALVDCPQMMLDGDDPPQNYTFGEIVCHDMIESKKRLSAFIVPWVELAIEEKQNCYNTYLDGSNNTVVVGCNGRALDRIIAYGLLYTTQLVQVATDSAMTCAGRGAGDWGNFRKVPASEQQDALICEMLRWGLQRSALVSFMGPAGVTGLATTCQTIAAHKSSNESEVGPPKTSWIGCGDAGEATLNQLAELAKIGGPPVIASMTALTQCIGEGEVDSNLDWEPAPNQENFTYDYRDIDEACALAWEVLVLALDTWSNASHAVATQFYANEGAFGMFGENETASEEGDQFSNHTQEYSGDPYENGTFVDTTPSTPEERVESLIGPQPSSHSDDQVWTADQEASNDSICVLRNVAVEPTIIGEWHPLIQQPDGTWVARYYIPNGATVRFRAIDAEGNAAISTDFIWPGPHDPNYVIKSVDPENSTWIGDSFPADFVIMTATDVMQQILVNTDPNRLLTSMSVQSSNNNEQIVIPSDLGVVYNETHNVTAKLGAPQISCHPEYNQFGRLARLGGDYTDTPTAPVSLGPDGRLIEVAGPLVVRDVVNEIFDDFLPEQHVPYEPLLELRPANPLNFTSSGHLNPCLRRPIDYLDSGAPGGLNEPRPLPDASMWEGIFELDPNRTVEYTGELAESLDIEDALNLTIDTGLCAAQPVVNTVQSIIERAVGTVESLTEFAPELINDTLNQVNDTLKTLDVQGLVPNVTSLLEEVIDIVNNTLASVQLEVPRAKSITDVLNSTLNYKPAKLLDLLTPQTKHPQFTYDVIAASPLASHWDKVQLADATVSDLTGVHVVATADAATANLYTNRSGTEKITRLPIGERTCIQLDDSVATRDLLGCDLYATLTPMATDVSPETLPGSPDSSALPASLYQPTISIESALPNQAYSLEAYGYVQVPNQAYVVSMGYDTRNITGTPVPDRLDLTLRGFHKTHEDQSETVVTLAKSDARNLLPVTFVTAGFEVQTTEYGKPRIGDNQTMLRGVTPDLPDHVAFGVSLREDAIDGQSSAVHLATDAPLTGEFLYREAVGSQVTLASGDIEQLTHGSSTLKYSVGPEGQLSAAWSSGGESQAVDLRLQRLTGGSSTMGFNVNGTGLPASVRWSAPDLQTYSYQASAAPTTLSFQFVGAGASCGGTQNAERYLWSQVQDDAFCTTGRAGGLESVTAGPTPQGYGISGRSAAGQRGDIDVLIDSTPQRHLFLDHPAETWSAQITDASLGNPALQWQASQPTDGFNLSMPLAPAAGYLLHATGSGIPSSLELAAALAEGEVLIEADAPWTVLDGFLTTTGSAAHEVDAASDYLRYTTSGPSSAVDTEWAWHIEQTSMIAAGLVADGSFGAEGNRSTSRNIELELRNGPEHAVHVEAENLTGSWTLASQDSTASRAATIDYTGTDPGAHVKLTARGRDATMHLDADDLPSALSVESDPATVRTLANASAPTGQVMFRYAPPAGYPMPPDPPENWIALRATGQQDQRGAAFDLTGILSVDARMVGGTGVVDVNLAGTPDLQLVTDDGAILQLLTIEDAGGHYEASQASGVMRWTSDQQATTFGLVGIEGETRFFRANATQAPTGLQATWTPKSADNFDALITQSTDTPLPYFHLEDSRILQAPGSAAVGGWRFEGHDLPATSILHLEPSQGLVEAHAMDSERSPMHTGQVRVSVADRTPELVLPPAFDGDAFWLRDTDNVVSASFQSQDMKQVQIRLYASADRAQETYTLSVDRAIATGLYVDADSQLWNAHVIVKAEAAAKVLDMRIQPGASTQAGFSLHATGESPWSNVEVMATNHRQNLVLETYGATPNSFNASWVPRYVLEVQGTTPYDMAFQWHPVGAVPPWDSSENDFIAIRAATSTDYAAGGRLTGVESFTAFPSERTVSFDGSLAVKPFQMDFLDTQIQTVIDGSDIPAGLRLNWSEAGRNYNYLANQAVSSFDFGTFVLAGDGARLYVALDGASAGATTFNQNADGVQFEFASPSALDRIKISADAAGSGPLASLANDGLTYVRNDRNPLYLNLAGIRSANVTMPDDFSTNATLDFTGGGSPAPMFMQINVPQQAIRGRLDSIGSSIVELTWPHPYNHEDIQFIAGGIGGHGIMMNYASGDSKGQVEVETSAPAWAYYANSKGQMKYRAAATRDGLSPLGGPGMMQVGGGGSLTAENFHAQSNLDSSNTIITANPAHSQVDVTPDEDYNSGTVTANGIIDDLHVVSQPGGAVDNAYERVQSDGNFVVVHGTCESAGGAPELQLDLDQVQSVDWDYGECSDPANGRVQADLTVRGSGTSTETELQVVTPMGVSTTNLPEGLADEVCTRLTSSPASPPPNDFGLDGWGLHYCSYNKPMEYHWSPPLVDELSVKIDIQKRGPRDGNLHVYPARFSGNQAPQVTYWADLPTSDLRMETQWNGASAYLNMPIAFDIQGREVNGVPTKLSATIDDPSGATAGSRPWDLLVTTQGTGEVPHLDLRLRPESVEAAQWTCSGEGGDRAPPSLYVDLTKQCIDVNGHNLRMVRAKLDPLQDTDPSILEWHQTKPGGTSPALSRQSRSVPVDLLTPREQIHGYLESPDGELRVEVWPTDPAHSTPGGLDGQAKMHFASEGGTTAAIAWTDYILSTGQTLETTLQDISGSSTITVRGREPTRFKLESETLGHIEFGTTAGERTIKMRVEEPGAGLDIAVRKGACKADVDSFAGAINTIGSATQRAEIEIYDVGATPQSVSRGHSAVAKCTQQDRRDSGPAETNMAVRVDLEHLHRVSWGVPVSFSSVDTAPRVDDCRGVYGMTFSQTEGDVRDVLVATHDVGDGSDDGSSKEIVLRGASEGDFSSVVASVNPTGKLVHDVTSTLRVLDEKFQRDLCMDYMQPTSQDTNVGTLGIHARGITAGDFSIGVSQLPLASELSSVRGLWPDKRVQWMAVAPSGGQTPQDGTYSTVEIDSTTPEASMSALKLFVPLMQPTGREAFDETQLIVRRPIASLDVHVTDREQPQMGVRGDKADGIDVDARGEGYEWRASYKNLQELQTASIRNCGQDNYVARHVNYTMPSRMTFDRFDLGDDCDMQILYFFDVAQEVWFNMQQPAGHVMRFAMDADHATIGAAHRRLCMQPGGKTCTNSDDLFWVLSFKGVTARTSGYFWNVLSSDGKTTDQGDLAVQTDGAPLQDFSFAKTRFTDGSGKADPTPGFEIGLFENVDAKISWNVRCGRGVEPYLAGDTGGEWLRIMYFRIQGAEECRNIQFMNPTQLFMGYKDGTPFRVKWIGDGYSDCAKKSDAQGKEAADRYKYQGAFEGGRRVASNKPNTAGAPGPVAAGMWVTYGLMVAAGTKAGWEAGKSAGYAYGYGETWTYCTEQWMPDHGFHEIARVWGMGCTSGGTVTLTDIPLATVSAGDLVRVINKRAWAKGSLDPGVPPPPEYCPKPPSDDKWVPPELPILMPGEVSKAVEDAVRPYEMVTEAMSLATDFTDWDPN